MLGGLFALDVGGASANSGYPLALRALYTCVGFDFLSSAVVTYCCALLLRVRTTERLWVRGCGDLKLRYWSVWVGFQERKLAAFFRFDGEFDLWIDAVYVFIELFHVVFVRYGECVVHVS